MVDTSESKEEVAAILRAPPSARSSVDSNSAHVHFARSASRSEIPTFELALADSRSGPVTAPSSATASRASGSIANLSPPPTMQRGSSVGNVRRRRDTNSPENTSPPFSRVTTSAGNAAFSPIPSARDGVATSRQASTPSVRRRNSFSRTGSVGKLKTSESSPKIKEDGAFSTLSLELARLSNEVASLKQRLANQQRAHESEQATAVSVAIEKERLERDRRLKAVAAASSATVRAAQDEMLRGFEKRFSAFQASLGDHQLLNETKMKESQVKELAAHLTLQEMMLAVQRNEIHALERQLASGQAGLEAAATYREMLKDVETKHAAQLATTQKALADSVQAQETTHELLQVYMHRCTDHERTIELEREEARAKQEELMHHIAQTRHIASVAFSTLAGQYSTAAASWKEDRSELFRMTGRKDEIIGRQDDSIARLLYENSQLLKQLQALGVFSISTQTHTETAAKIASDRIRAGMQPPTGVSPPQQYSQTTHKSSSVPSLGAEGGSKENSPPQDTTTIATTAAAVAAGGPSSSVSPPQGASALSSRTASTLNLHPSGRTTVTDAAPTSPNADPSAVTIHQSASAVTLGHPHRPHSASVHSFGNVRFLEANYRPILLPQVGTDPFAFAATLPPGAIPEMPQISSTYLQRSPTLSAEQSPHTTSSFHRSPSRTDHSPQSPPRNLGLGLGSGASMPPSPMLHGARSPASGSPFTRPRGHSLVSGGTDGHDSPVLHQAKISSRVPFEMQWPSVAGGAGSNALPGHAPTLLGVHGSSHAVSFMRDLTAEGGEHQAGGAAHLRIPTGTRSPGVLPYARSRSNSISILPGERTPVQRPQQVPTPLHFVLDLNGLHRSHSGTAHIQHSRSSSAFLPISGAGVSLEPMNDAGPAPLSLGVTLHPSQPSQRSRSNSIASTIAEHSIQLPQERPGVISAQSRAESLYAAVTREYPQAGVHPDEDLTPAFQTRAPANFLNTVDRGSNLLPIGLNGQPVAPASTKDLPQETVIGLSQEWRRYQAAKSSSTGGSGANGANAVKKTYPDVERERAERERLAKQKEEEKRKAHEQSLMSASSSAADLDVEQSPQPQPDTSRTGGRTAIALHYVSPQLDVPAPLESPEERHLHHSYVHQPIRANVHSVSPQRAPPTDGLSHKAHALIAAALQSSMPFSYNSQTSSSGTKVQVQLPSIPTASEAFKNNSVSAASGGGTARGRERRRDLRGKRMKPSLANVSSSPIQPHPPSVAHPSLQPFGHRSVSQSPEPSPDGSPIASDSSYSP